MLPTGSPLVVPGVSAARPRIHHDTLPSTLLLRHPSLILGRIGRQVRAVHSRVGRIINPNPASSGSESSAGQTEQLQDRAPCLATDTKAT